MSFKELRNFTEMMRALNYPTAISMEGFRTPNFAHVAKILVWIAKKFDPSIEIPMEISTESERVQFMKLIIQILHEKSGVTVSAQKLYRADGYAVRELHKLAQLLYDSTKEVSLVSDTLNADFVPFQLPPTWTQDAKEAKTISNNLVKSGATIHNLLEQEAQMRQNRRSAIKATDNEKIEDSIKNRIKTAEIDLEDTKQTTNMLKRDEKDLLKKIESNKKELERAKNRLKELQNSKPAFMDEYTGLEKELQLLYIVYLEKIRNLDFLDNELDKVFAIEAESNLKQKHVLEIVVGQQNQLERETLIRGAGSYSEDEESEDDHKISLGTTQEDRPSTQRGQRRIEQTDAFSDGSLSPLDSEDEVDEGRKLRTNSPSASGEEYDDDNENTSSDSAF